ncbi:MAG TPA: LCP family protein [Actinomycetota bacterium]|nr:LCP family protein [Actinomycetota bacterium]
MNQRIAGPGRDITAVQRRRRRHLVIVSLFMLWGLVFSAGYWLAEPFKADAAQEAVGIHKVQGASWKPELGQPLFIAVLGSDARKGPIDGGGGRCDAIHIVAINPQQKAGTILNFPRDSWVNIPGHGTQKINSACSSGGGPLMVETLKNLTGIPIQYYVITEFSHFMDMVNELGGVDVVIPYAMNDTPSAAFFPAGPRHLTGGEALAFSRNRKGTPNGDFSRTENQGALLIASLAKFRAETADPHRMFDFIKIARRHAAISVPVPELVKLGLLARDIDPGSVLNHNIPGSTGSAGGASVVHLSPGDAYARVADDAIY